MINKLPFIAILISYLLAGWLYATMTPPWQSPDEPAHYNYIRYLATRGAFPAQQWGCYDQAYLSRLTSEQFPPSASIEPLCYEYHQPPLYYLSAVPIYWLTQGDMTALRDWSVLLGAGVVTLTYAIARLIDPTSLVIPAGAMAFVAFVPMHGAMLAAINNDSLAELLLVGLLWLLLYALQPERLSTQRWLAPTIGLLLGLILLTKLTVYIAVPLVAVAIGLATPDGRTWLKSLTLIYSLALLMALPWYGRNLALYGGLDILGLQRHNEIVVGQLRTATHLAEIGWSSYMESFISTTFHSFWGQFGWMAVPMDERTYWFLTLASLVALGGFIAYLRRAELSRFQRQAIALMLLTIGFISLAYGWYNWQYVQFQGRYLFPAIVPLGVCFTLGLHEAFQPRWQRWLITALGLMVAWVALTGLSQGELDKWSLLLTGLLWGLVMARLMLSRYLTISAAWFVAGWGILLGGLTLLAPYWFIKPFLG